ncbi:MAG TPA: hypothetical protein VF291_11045 [Burkholderiaceae bacterium]
MHLIIPFASVLSEAGRHAMRGLALPHLDELLARLAPVARDAGDEYGLSPPHERALAGALGLEGGDGLLPWGAHGAAARGIATEDLAWGLVTPAHCRVGTSEISLVDPAALALDEAESRALFEAVHPLFEAAGFVLLYGAPLEWYAAHESLAELASASLDRVVGRRLDPWLAPLERARGVRRLQNEVQMLLHGQPANEAREARGALAVNSFWLSGCGVHQPARDVPGLRVDDALRASALGEDWHAWRAAWRSLDAGPLAEALAAARRGDPVALTLCGERHAQRHESRPLGLVARLAQRLRPAAGDARAVLESL